MKGRTNDITFFLRSFSVFDEISFAFVRRLTTSAKNLMKFWEVVNINSKFVSKLWDQDPHNQHFITRLTCSVMWIVILLFLSVLNCNWHGCISTYSPKPTCTKNSVVLLVFYITRMSDHICKVEKFVFVVFSGSIYESFCEICGICEKPKHVDEL